MVKRIIATLNVIMPFLQQCPKWIQVLVAAGLIYVFAVIVVILIWFLFFSSPQKQKPNLFDNHGRTQLNSRIKNMMSSQGSHIHLQKVHPMAGFAATDIPPKAFGWILTRAFVCSDDSEFYLYCDQISKMFLKSCFVDNICNYLILLHIDLSADVYINFPFQAKMMAKCKPEAGKPIYLNEIADIAELRFPDITIKENDSVVFCFKKGWKFGLFFDFCPVDRKSTLDVERLFHDLGSYYRYLTFQELYSILENKPLFESMFSDGWFPFIQLLGGDFEELSKCYEHKSDFPGNVDSFLSRFDEDRINTFTNRWWKKQIFDHKRQIIEAGIEAYLLETPAGYINCVKTLYSEIDGIVRMRYVDEKKKEPNFRELIDYVKQKAEGKFGPRESLGFSDVFYRYLNEVVFRKFDLKTGQIDLSRHSALHGVAEHTQYTKNKAIQAILILDQMYFYLT